MSGLIKKINKYFPSDEWEVININVMEIYKKILKAKEVIKQSKLTKQGKNTYSNYDYFTPEQVDKLVFEACKEANLLTIFNLKRNELGIYGHLKIVDIDSNTEVNIEMASDIPQIKATNIAQQLGGAMTYTKRYMLMNAFDIVDNNLDFDTSENTKKTEDNSIEWLTQEQFEKALNSSIKGIEATLKTYNTSTKKMKKSFKEELTNKLNDLKNG